jgi:hypothetical protein
LCLFVHALGYRGLGQSLLWPANGPLRAPARVSSLIPRRRANCSEPSHSRSPLESHSIANQCGYGAAAWRTRPARS